MSPPILNVISANPLTNFPAPLRNLYKKIKKLIKYFNDLSFKLFFNVNRAVSIRRLLTCLTT